jgi:hypothetical protein
MHRTTILLPTALWTGALQESRRLGISLGEFLRQSLEAGLKTSRRSRRRDSFWSDDRVYEGKGPTDMALRHDDYLYGDKSDFH